MRATMNSRSRIGLMFLPGSMNGSRMAAARKTAYRCGRTKAIALSPSAPAGTEKDYDLYVASMNDPKAATIVVQQGGSWSPLDWSPDDKKLVVENLSPLQKSFLHVVDLDRENWSHSTLLQRIFLYGGAWWSADGKAHLSRIRPGLGISPAQSTMTWKQKIHRTSRARSPGYFRWCHQSVENSDRFYDQRERYIEAVPAEYSDQKIHGSTGIPTGVIGGLKFHPEGKQLGFVLNTPQTPVTSIRLILPRTSFRAGPTAKWED